MKTLHLNLKKKWFDMIRTGEKPEEYREITPYYVSRLFNWKQSEYSLEEFTTEAKAVDNILIWNYLKFENDDTLTFSNGYSKQSPRIEVEWEGIDVAEGKKEWGAEPGKKYFVFTLGKIIK